MSGARGAALALLLAVRPAAADQRVLDQTGAGLVPLNDEKTLEVRGVEGEIVLQTGPEGSVEFVNASLGRATDEVPLVLSTDGATISLVPPEGRAGTKSRLRLTVPPKLAVLLEANNAAIHANELNAELKIRGSQIKFDGTGMLGRTELEIEGGSVRVQSTTDAVTLRGSGLETVLERIAGATSLRLEGGSVKLTGLQGGLTAEFVRTRVGADTITGQVDLGFKEGSAQLAGLREGGRISAAGCRLVLTQASGDLTITSDSEVQFSESRAYLHIENTSGGVKGTHNEGLVEITTHKAAVTLDQIIGQLKIAGDELQVALKNIGAATTISTHESAISIDGTSTVTLENDGGNVSIRRSESRMEIKAQQGEVHLLEMRGPITLDADGPVVEVEWMSLPPDGNSKIVNEGGDVNVKILGGDGRVDATSAFGHVESTLPGVRVGKEDTNAQGIIGGGGNRSVVIKASGYIRLDGPGAEEPSGQAP